MNKTKSKSAPCCVFCHRSAGAQFVIFNPRFKPFGTACAECEEKIPQHIQTPAEYFATKTECDERAAAAADRAEQFNTELDTLLQTIRTKATDQFAYNEATNIPGKIIEPGDSVESAISHGIAAGWNTVNSFSCDHAIKLAYEILEDANCHTEAARLAA